MRLALDANPRHASAALFGSLRVAVRVSDPHAEVKKLKGRIQRNTHAHIHVHMCAANDMFTSHFNSCVRTLCLAYARTVV